MKPYCVYCKKKTHSRRDCEILKARRQRQRTPCTSCGELSHLLPADVACPNYQFPEIQPQRPSTPVPSTPPATSPAVTTSNSDDTHMYDPIRGTSLLDSKHAHTQQQQDPQSPSSVSSANIARQTSADTEDTRVSPSTFLLPPPADSNTRDWATMMEEDDEQADISSDKSDDTVRLVSELSSTTNMEEDSMPQQRQRKRSVQRCARLT
ncbi:hypothetical protein BDB00DRAFT_805092 [Zychaea mexicana]|uniref:uncharacterized protein n=1 Tax=Zychaea mexicana TaxID=64656 RepID=UPI0022FED057|nr:uncharacterized protein BDB00DRAFT_805092 [Zychaea mexicana]KAI9497126.1 hypothetical protein BDB00DRAFT_805092 [Zychaea mexicana]